MNAICGLIWLLSAGWAAWFCFEHVRRSIIGAARVFSVVLAGQTAWAFVLLGAITPALGGRAAVPDSLYGVALALSVPAFWVHLLCWQRDSNKRNVAT